MDTCLNKNKAPDIINSKNMKTIGKKIIIDKSFNNCFSFAILGVRFSDIAYYEAKSAIYWALLSGVNKPVWWAVLTKNKRNA